MAYDNYRKTTIYISKSLLARAKIRAALSETSVSHLITIALKELLDRKP